MQAKSKVPTEELLAVAHKAAVLGAEVRIDPATVDLHGVGNTGFGAPCVGWLLCTPPPAVSRASSTTYAPYPTYCPDMPLRTCFAPDPFQ